MILTLIYDDIVYCGQITEKDLPFSIASPNSEKLIRCLQIHLTDHTFLFLGAALARLQAQ